MKSRMALTVAVVLAAGLAQAGSTDIKQLIAQFSSEAGITASAARGEAFFTARHSGGKPDTPSCTTCHSTNLKGMGQTRAGKPIEPMAHSVNPSRFTDTDKVAKWFRRNCKSVVGRECTAGEKADILAYLASI